jgi:hypothetical protein
MVVTKKRHFERENINSYDSHQNESFTKQVENCKKVAFIDSVQNSDLSPLPHRLEFWDTVLKLFIGKPKPMRFSGEHFFSWFYLNQVSCQ